MLSLAMASMVYVAAVQNAAANSARSAFSNCVRDAAAKAKQENIPVDDLAAKLRAACEAESAKLKAALVAFDLKNGVSRKQAAADADLQMDDYYVAQEERYRYEIDARKPKEALAAKPTETTTAK